MKELIKFSNGNGIVLTSYKGVKKYCVCKDLKLEDRFTYKVVDYTSFDDYSSALKKFKSLNQQKFIDLLVKTKNHNSHGYYVPDLFATDPSVSELFISEVASILDMLIEKSIDLN